MRKRKLKNGTRRGMRERNLNEHIAIGVFGEKIAESWDAWCFSGL
jgi:hypothetical protein